MNLWLGGALALMPALAVSGGVVIYGTGAGRLVALQLASLLAALVILLVAAGTAQPWIADLALGQILVSFAGTLAYAHFLERWL